MATAERAITGVTSCDHVSTYMSETTMERQRLLTWAAEHGDLKALQGLLTCRDVWEIALVCELAAQHGQVDLLRWLHSEGLVDRCFLATVEDMCWAATRGQQWSVVQWLFDTFASGNWLYSVAADVNRHLPSDLAHQHYDWLNRLSVHIVWPDHIKAWLHTVKAMVEGGLTETMCSDVAGLVLRYC